MTFQAYLDTIKTKTGKSPDDFRQLAAEKGFTKYPEVMSWLKTDFGLGHGHANALAQLLVNAEKLQVSPDDKISGHFKGDKARWQAPYDSFISELAAWGEDFKTAPTSTYISLLRGSKKFGIIQISSAERIDIGIKLKDAEPVGRFETSGSWNNMVTHRVRISDPQQLDSDVYAWLKQAYQRAS